MSRIIPGVEVKVVKEVVPPQLAPSGILGLIGLTENTLEHTERASSWSRFLDVCGPASAYSMPEARLALGNGVFELVITPIKPSGSARAAAADLNFSSVSFTLTAQQPDLTVTLTAHDTVVFDLEIVDTTADTKKLAELTVSQLKATLAGSKLVKMAGEGDAIPKGSSLKTNLSAHDSGVFDLAIADATGVKEEHEALTLDTLTKTLGSSTLVQVGNVGNAKPLAGRFPLQQYHAVPIAAGPETGTGVEARAPGVWANGFKLKVSHRADKFDLEIRSASAAPNDPLEVLRNLEPGTMADRLRHDSALIRLKPGAVPARPPEGEYELGGGADAGPDDYLNALEALKDESDVDMVLAAIQDFSDVTKINKIYSGVISHCQAMSTDSKGRIAFGQVPPSASMDDAKTMANTLLSDRFVLLAPHGVAGAVAGRIGSLDYFQSPTFKTLSGLAALSRAIPLEEQSQLLQAHAVPVVEQRGRGVIILRALTTDGDQISVRRVADRAVRGVRMLGELFIGRLNNEEGRGALKQKLAEFLVQMQRDGALVPSTDGKDGGFKLDVYSSQADFAQGIVRVDIAVRPVRAIDFIYATILVQV